MSFHVKIHNHVTAVEIDLSPRTSILFEKRSGSLHITVATDFTLAASEDDESLTLTPDESETLLKNLAKL